MISPQSSWRMKPYSHSAILSVLLPALTVILAPFATAADNLDALVARSPFAPPGKVSVRGTSAPTRIEFGGYLEIGGKTEVSLLNIATREAVWVALRDKSAPFFVESFDPSGPAVIVKLDGTSVRLPLRNAPAEAPLTTSPTPPSPAAGQAAILDAGAPKIPDAEKQENPRVESPASSSEPFRIPAQKLRTPRRADDIKTAE